MLCLHKPVDLVKAVVVDDLHCLFLGVSKLLISLWFSKTYRSFDFYIGEKVFCLKLILIIIIIIMYPMYLYSWIYVTNASLALKLLIPYQEYQRNYLT